VYEGSLEFGVEGDQPLLSLDRPPHRRQKRRDLPLLPEWWESDLQTFELTLVERIALYGLVLIRGEIDL